MAQYSPEELEFLDKTSKDNKMLSRHFEWLRKGRWAEKKQALVRGRCTSTEALLTLDGIVAGTVVEGSIMKARWSSRASRVQCGKFFLGIFMIAPLAAAKLHCLSWSPECPCDGQHKIHQTWNPWACGSLWWVASHFCYPFQQLTRPFSGVWIEYLPLYSPDLNPIEEAFLKIKYWICHYQDDYSATTGDGILFDMYEVMDIITAGDVKVYFVHAGYF